LESFY
jgi:MFS family permease